MITVSGLTLRIEGRVVLDNISLEVGRGRSVGLVGPNGSGKTSLLRCLLGLAPFEGRATVGGRDVLREPIAARALSGYLPQKAAFGDLLAEEALVLVARLRGIPRERVGQALRQVGLERHARDRVRYFSGGMQQRLSLALVLLADAPVLFLDEPTASLDREGLEVFFAAIERLRARETTMLLASHRPEEVARLTDEVIRLDAGRVVEPAAGDGRVARAAAAARPALTGLRPLAVGGER